MFGSVRIFGPLLLLTVILLMLYNHPDENTNICKTNLVQLLISLYFFDGQSFSKKSRNIKYCVHLIPSGDSW